MFIYISKFFVLTFNLIFLYSLKAPKTKAISLHFSDVLVFYNNFHPKLLC